METFTTFIPVNPLTYLGYTPVTTLWEDFSIADRFGDAAIEDTYNRVCDQYQTNYKVMTELILVLNHKIWQHYQNNVEIAKLYQQLWQDTDSWCVENLTGKQLDYYYQTLDFTFHFLSHD